MIYCKLYKNWLATCMRCGLVLANIETSLKFEIPKTYLDYDSLRKYCIMDADFYYVRSSCGKCMNKNCKAYLKNQ